jgi:hypothetical protein
MYRELPTFTTSKYLRIGVTESQNLFIELKYA